MQFFENSYNEISLLANKIIAIISLALLASCGQTTTESTTTNNQAATSTTESAPKNACEVYFEKLSCSLKAQNLGDDTIAQQIDSTKKFIESQLPTEQAASCQTSLDNLKSSNLLGNC